MHMKRISAIVALLSFTVLMGVLVSGCNQGGSVSANSPRSIYVDLQRVAEQHPAWRQAAACSVVGGELRESRRLDAALRGGAMLVDGVVKPSAGVDEPVAASPVSSSADREIAAFEKSERAAAQSWVEAQRTAIVQRWESNYADSKRECNEELAGSLRAASETYAAKALPLRLGIQALKSSDGFLNGLGDGIRILHPDRAVELKHLEDGLAVADAERDAAWAGAMAGAKSKDAKNGDLAKAEAENLIADLRNQAEVAVLVKVSEKRAAAVPLRDRYASAGRPVVDVAPSNTDPPPKKAYLPSASECGGALNEAASRLLAKREMLRAWALRDARSFVSAVAEAHGLRVVFDRARRAGIPDRTDDFTREFSRGLAVSGQELGHGRT